MNSLFVKSLLKSIIFGFICLFPIICNRSIQSTPLISGQNTARANTKNFEALPDRAICQNIESKFDLWKNGTCLRGANIWQKRLKAVKNDQRCGKTLVENCYTYEKDLKPLSESWNANYVNLSIPGIYSEKPDRNGEYFLIPELLTNLKSLIEQANHANLFVVVSFRTGPGRNESNFGGENDPVLKIVWRENLEGEKARTGWKNMWVKAVEEIEKYKNVVGYDLMVEPNAKKPQMWNKLAKDITTAIREEDKKTPILIGGSHKSSGGTVDSLSTLVLTGDEKTVYTIHQYNPYNYSNRKNKNAEFSCPIPNLPPICHSPNQQEDPDYSKADVEKKLNGTFKAIDDWKGERPNVVIAFNEFGANRWVPYADWYINKQMEEFERRGANHALWLWETSDCIGYDQMNFRNGPKPENHFACPTSDFINKIQDNWRANSIRPSDVVDKF